LQGFKVEKQKIAVAVAVLPEREEIFVGGGISGTGWIKTRLNPRAILRLLQRCPVRAIHQFAQPVVILIGLRCAILARNLPVGSDGLAYMDLARAYLHHDWSIVVNGYWGALYAWLLAAVLFVVHPGARQEFATARGLNFLIFLFCFYAFQRFWRSVARWNEKPSDEGPPLPEAYPAGWALLGYVLFVTRAAWYVGLVGPDLLAASVVLLTSALGL